MRWYVCMIRLPSSCTYTNLVCSQKHYFEWSPLNDLAEGVGQVFRDFLVFGSHPPPQACKRTNTWGQTLPIVSEKKKRTIAGSWQGDRRDGRLWDWFGCLLGHTGRQTSHGGETEEGEVMLCSCKPSKWASGGGWSEVQEINEAGEVCGREYMRESWGNPVITFSNSNKPNK